MSKNKNEEVLEDANAVEDQKDQETSKKSSKKKKSKKDAELEELRLEVDTQKDKYLRLFAEFDNFKKRTAKEQLNLRLTASSDTIKAMLPIIDDFDRAKKAAEDENNDEVFSEGIKLVYDKIHSTLKAKGLEEMVSTGEVFDPELHQALTEIPAPSEDLKGKIVDTIEKGYLLNDKIIRHAKVVIGK